ncbi:hypothetical protein QNJ95_42695 [Bradyrhizobium elkanii]|uniref:hypothetical protein n=1 Tax=Bradyrhizobium TaxID=374 RepID=UPI002711D548|nr:hypothetical protein [Bradyrhizobium elkanii]WLA39480.1 hypothetical protein QNJ95_42695 [Bradyrhizobium elkanii]
MAQTNEMIACGDQLDRMDRRLAEIEVTRPRHPGLWECRHDVRRVYAALEVAQASYRGVSRAQWLEEQDEMEPRRVSLQQLWRLWRSVLAARQALADLGDSASNRQRIDAQTARDAAEALYDLRVRTFDGQPPRSWEERSFQRLRVLPPRRPEPTPASKIQNRRRRKFGKRPAFDKPYGGPQS